MLLYWIVDVKCTDNLNSLLTVVANLVHDSKVSEAVIEELLQSINTYYPGLKVIVGVSKNVNIKAEMYKNVQIKVYTYS